MFVTQGVGCVTDQIEQSIATRFDMRAVLDIVGRPILLSCRVVTLVKQCVESVEYQRLVSLLYCLTHNNFLILSWLEMFSDALQQTLDLLPAPSDYLPYARAIWPTSLAQGISIAPWTAPASGRALSLRISTIKVA